MPMKSTKPLRNKGKKPLKKTPIGLAYKAYRRTEWLTARSKPKKNLGIKVLGAGVRIGKDYVEHSYFDDYEYSTDELTSVDKMCDFKNLKQGKKVFVKFDADLNDNFPAGYYQATVVRDERKGDGIRFKAKYNSLINNETGRNGVEFDGFDTDSDEEEE